MPHDPLSPVDLLVAELDQRRESGYDISSVEVPDRVTPEQADVLLDELDRTERVAGWRYEEPDGLDEILAVLPADPPRGPAPGEEELGDRLLGAWLGRCAGCNLGKPVENGAHWTAEHLRDYLERAGAYPLRDYIPVLDPMPDGFELRDNWTATTRGRVAGSARDDDVDYTILGLHLLETRGFEFTPGDVATLWLERLPFLQTYTAERAAYRNLVSGLRPPATAVYRNPFREWIGALIRADVFGYVHAGRPRQAARLAYKDAAVSHVGNGIYGEMWSAALVAAAFTAGSAREAVETSLAHVPPRSRLHEALTAVLRLHSAGTGWSEAREELAVAYGGYGWVHTVNNATAIAAGVLWGDGDFSASVGLTVQAGWDTDSNGATAGSVAGALAGAKALPEHWTTPLQDRARSAVFGYDDSRISDLAGRTLRLALDAPGR